MMMALPCSCFTVLPWLLLLYLILFFLVWITLLNFYSNL
uniref:Uncharacterized protein n=1 Tax=Rhizophora mucronata TaxID=61149 RepID=A0A2P2JTC3_RHIMU